MRDFETEQSGSDLSTGKSAPAGAEGQSPPERPSNTAETIDVTRERGTDEQRGESDRGQGRIGFGLSRRQLLYAVAATGAAAGSGSGVAAMLTDTERVGSQFTVGTLDLDVDVRSPSSWQHGAYTGSLGINESETAVFELSVDSNPAYVWLVAPCQSCEPIESKLDVRLDLTIPGADTVTLFDGTLGAFRAAYGSGALLSTQALASDGETWTVTFTWTLTEPVADTDVAFGFEFRAVQQRHLGDPRAYDLGLPACAPCDETGDCGKDISYVAFCSDEPIDPADVTFARHLCGDTDRYATLEVTALPAHVDRVLLKHGTTLDVFAYDGEAMPFGITTGGGQSDLVLVATYGQDGNEYPGSGTPPRSNSDPCPGTYSHKHEFGASNGDDQVDHGQSDSSGGDE